jgi:SsrA-binding protein
MSILLKNPRAKADYQILKEFEAGISLLGPEVKSLRLGRGSLKGAHVKFLKNSAFIINMTIQPYQPANQPNYDPLRSRPLLLTKKETNYLLRSKRGKSIAIIPLSCYTKGPYIKLKIALAKGKKLFEKREIIKKRSLERSLRRSLKRG